MILTLSLLNQFSQQMCSGFCFPLWNFSPLNVEWCFLPSAAHLVEEALPCQPVPDVSEELSRQLEDILSTYCRDSNQEGPGEDNGQNESVELDEPEKCQSESPRNGDQEQNCPEINGEKEGPRGIGDESGERDHKRVQERKKPRGLGRKFSADRPAFPLFFQKSGNEEAQGGMNAHRGYPCTHTYSP